MLFNSFHYIIFLVTVTLVYWIIPGRLRWILLAIASLVFYSAHIPEYVAVLLLSVIMNYYFGLAIGKSTNVGKRKKLLVTGIVLNVLLLGLFKYADDLLGLLIPAISSKGTLNDLFLMSLKNSDSPFFRIIMPLGISFFTFTNIAYLIDVKRGTTEAEKHAGHFAVFITFFPKLIQGPIERANKFLPQIKIPRVFSNELATDGLRLLLWGFFKKLVIADRIGVAVDHVFDSPATHPGPVLVYAAVLFSFQIYLDFSSYIDMARGAGKLLGFDLSKNFNMPYLATSIKDFWDRWHITLSTWLRDYIFLPVAFKTSSTLKNERYFGIKTDQIIYASAASATFLLAGLWHGTGWTYIIWGGLFAFYLIVANLTLKAKRRFYRKTGLVKRKGLLNVLEVIVTFTLVTFTWIFFRSGNTDAAITYLKGIPYRWDILTNSTDILYNFTFPAFTGIDLGLVVCATIFSEVTEYFISTGKAPRVILNPPRYVRWGLYYALLLLLVGFGKFESDAFIYFKF